jgi:hypothetical protein
VTDPKVGGILKEILSSPSIDVADHLEFELAIPRYKAELMAKRIQEKYLQNKQTKPPASSRLFVAVQEPQSKHGYNLCCLSDVEFCGFVCWLLEESGYRVQSEKTYTQAGFKAVAEVDEVKTLVYVFKAPQGYGASESALALAEDSKKRLGCQKALVICTGGFSEAAAAKAQSLDVELWDSAALNEHVAQAKRSCEAESASHFPPFEGTLFDSLLKLEEGKEFLVELKAEWRYEVLLPGVKYPLLTFMVRGGAVSRLVFRIKYNEPVTEAEGEVVVGVDEAGNRVGPSEGEAYMRVIQYLEQFIQ